MHTRKFKVGDFAIVTALPSENVSGVGDKVRIERYNRQFGGEHCWYVVSEEGKRTSCSEKYLVLHVEPEKITLEQVVAAKNVVDKAQKMFIELLSKYQLQEASK